MNKDIYQALLAQKNQDFTIKDIAIFLMYIPEYQIKHDSLERFISNHLNNLTNHNLLTYSRKKGMNYVFSFSSAFYQEEFQLKRKPKRTSTSSDFSKEKEILWLKEEKGKCEVEVDAKLAEIAEYKLLDKKLIKLKKPLSLCMSNAMKKIDMLKSKINAIESVLNVVKNAS